MRKNVEIGRTVRRERGQTARPTIFLTAAPWARRSLYFRFLRNGHRQRKQIDEAFGVLRVVARHGKTRETFSVKRIGRHAPRDGDISLLELQSHCSGHALL